MNKTKALIAGMAVLLGGFLYAQEEAYIRELTGTVEVKDPGAAEWRAARTEERLSRNTLISTGFKSTARIVLGNSTVIVRPLTRLSLEEIQNTQGSELVNLYLQTGRVRAEVNPPASGKTDFTIRSPTATASVRGTTFEFNGENLIVDEGKVHVTGGDGSSVYVGAGYQVFSNPETGRTTEVAEAAKERLTPGAPAAAVEDMPETAQITPATLDTGVGMGFDWK
jgi:hypothetical protein